MSDETDNERRSYLGGPAAAAVLGVNPWMTPVALWQFLTGRAPPLEINGRMRSGQRLERAVLDYAGEELGAKILPGPFIRDAQRPLGGHLDGVLEAKPQIVEAKTSYKREGWGEPGTDEVPQHVAAQALHYLGLTDAEVCWVPVLFTGLDFALYKVERNEELIRTIRELCLDWWQRYVVTDTPPPPVNGADAIALFPKDRGTIVIADDATVEAVTELRDVKHQLDDLEVRRDALESKIKLRMGDAATLVAGDKTVATWKTAKASLRFDSTAFKAAAPETYLQYCREVSTRRFLLKDVA